MTPFTDADIRQMKKNRKSGINLAIGYREWDAIIARLESAEAIAEAACECGIGKPLWETWLKSAGKE